MVHLTKNGSPVFFVDNPDDIDGPSRDFLAYNLVETAPPQELT
jgi:hypothetical protein